MLAGFLGLAIGVSVFAGATLVKTHISWLAPSLNASLLVFAIIFLIAILEMPFMAFGLRQIAAARTVPRKMIAVGFLAYVGFAAVYAGIYVLVTGDQYFCLGSVLTGLGLVRFFTGVYVR